MKVSQLRWSDDEWKSDGATLPPVQLVLAFGGSTAFRGRPLEALRAKFPDAHVLGCSTAGEIQGTRVHDDACVATAVSFERSRVVAASEPIRDRQDSRDVGRRLAARFDREGLVHVFVLSEGSIVNGSELAKGLSEGLPEWVAVTGGLSGDGDRFGPTHVWLDGPPCEGLVAAVAFYGDSLRVGFGSLGGWDPFGPERIVTRSQGNVVYEFDGQSALSLYRSYLGEHAAGLPASGLLFPLSVSRGPGTPGLVRTILGIDEATGGLVFAGDVPSGSHARLMKANFDRLVDGATGAARAAALAPTSTETLGVLISCVGRKLVLRQRVEEEVESVQEVLGASAFLTGFYSYGEICPVAPNASCELHNQTMTITTFTEVDCTSSSHAS